MHMEKSMTVMQDFPIGCKDGLTLRRCREKKKKQLGVSVSGKKKRFLLVEWLGLVIGYGVEVGG